VIAKEKRSKTEPKNAVLLDDLKVLAALPGNDKAWLPGAEKEIL
jgi:hypothetical protein